MTDLLLGIVTDGAGIENDFVGLIEISASLEAIFLEDSGNYLAVREVHLTAVAFNVQFPGVAPVLLKGDAYGFTRFMLVRGKYIEAFDTFHWKIEVERQAAVIRIRTHKDKKSAANYDRMADGKLNTCPDSVKKRYL